jgi:hypothetical protein
VSPVYYIDWRRQRAFAAVAEACRAERWRRERRLRIVADKLDGHSGVPLMITRFVPLQLKKRGVELRIVMDGESASTSAIDPTLLKAIARGHRWFNELASNRARDTLEIAKRVSILLRASSS